MLLFITSSEKLDKLALIMQFLLKDLAVCYNDFN